MPLSEQDKTDLVGLASGLGTSDSDDRARDLLTRDSSAAEYLRQVDHVTAAFERVTPSDQESFPQHEIDRLTQSILDRAAMAPESAAGEHRRLKLPRPWLVGGIAAGLLLLAYGTWHVVDRPLSSESAEGVHVSLIPPGGNVGLEIVTSSRLEPGEALESEENCAVVELSGSSILVLAARSQITWDAPDRISVDAGSLYVSTAEPLTVSMKMMTCRVSNAAATLALRGGAPFVHVHSGEVACDVPGQDYQIQAGEKGHWIPDENRMRQTPWDHDPPPWAIRAIEMREAAQRAPR